MFRLDREYYHTAVVILYKLQNLKNIKITISFMIQWKKKMMNVFYTMIKFSD